MPYAPDFSFFEAYVALRTPSFSVRRGARLHVSEKPMKLASFESIARALDDAGVRYLVAGGLAVNPHGYLSFTKDVDIVAQLVPDNVLRFFVALHTIGFRPSVPVTAARSADRLAPDNLGRRTPVSRPERKVNNDEHEA